MRSLIIMTFLLQSLVAMAEDTVFRIDGSDTLAPFIRMNIPDWLATSGGKAVSISNNGSSAGIQKLIEGKVWLAGTSREMSKNEYDQYVKKNVHQPLLIKVAIDGVRVIVHKNNSLEGIKLSDLGRVYSSKGGCTSEQGITDWSELKTNVNGKVLPISRDTSSGTFGFLNKRVFCDNPMFPTVQKLGSHEGIIDKVSNNPLSIGYVSMNWQSESVKTLPIWSKVAKRYVYLDEASITYGYYPLARHLMIYAPLGDKGRLKDTVKSLLKVMLSPEGQAKAEMLGYTKLPDFTLKKQLMKLNRH